VGVQVRKRRAGKRRSIVVASEVKDCGNRRLTRFWCARVPLRRCACRITAMVCRKVEAKGSFKREGTID
jgi:hypothetical protein